MVMWLNHDQASQNSFPERPCYGCSRSEPNLFDTGLCRSAEP